MRKPKAEQYFLIGRLLLLADDMQLKVRLADLIDSDGRISGDRIAIRDGMPEEKTAYILAHEIAHAALHFDKGDIIGDPDREEQADRAAGLLLRALSL